MLSLTSIDCPKDQQNLRNALVRLYKRLDEITKGLSPFGNFVSKDDLAKKFHLEVKTYPRLKMEFLPEDLEALAGYAGMDRNDLLACATTPLERLMVATLWKQNDLGKIGHIAAGIVESNGVSIPSPKTQAPVFKQFGRHLSQPESQPIADQHSLRAFRYLIDQDLSDKRHKQDSVKTEEVERYVEWVQRLIRVVPRDNRADQMYEFDRSMFALGKATKFFIEAALPPEKKN